MRLIVLLLVVAMGVFPASNRSIYAQTLPNQFYMDHYTIPGVIKSTFIACIEQDEFGLLWFGTSSGLFRYDGHQFTQYPYADMTGFVLEARQINAMLWDTVAHRLIIGTRMGGLLQFSYDENSLSKLTDREATIHDLKQTPDGRIWVSTPTGLFELVNNSLQLIGNTKEIKGPVSLFVEGDNLLVGCVGQVVVYHNGKKIRVIRITAQGRNFPSTLRVSALMVDRNHRLWVGTEKEGVLVYNLETEKLVMEFLPDERPYFSRINAILQDKEGLVWMLTKAEGLIVYDPQTNKSMALRQTIYDENSLSGNNAYSIYEDRTGVLWIGTNGDINYYDRQQRKFEHLIHNPANNNSLSDNMVRSVYETNDGKLWIGTDGGFINIVDRITNKIERIKIEGAELPENESIVPFCFLEMDKEQVLVGTSKGLLSFDRVTKRFKNYQPTYKFIGDKRVRQLVMKDGKLYGIIVGVMFGYDFATQHFFVYSFPKRNNATIIALDTKDRMWVGSNGAISIIDTKKPGSLKYMALPRDTANFMILNLQAMGDKMLVSTMNYGIFEVVAKHDSIIVEKNITTFDGLSDNTVYATIVDDFGNIWIPSNRGLTRLDPNGGFTNYDVSEGLQAEEFNRMTHLKRKNGEIVVGGINGINIIDPKKAITKSVEALPIIFSLTTRATDRYEDRTLMILRKEEIKLQSYERSFSVNFGVSDFKKSNRYEVRYRLENFDDTWIESETFDRVTYSQLRPGKYIFRVKVTNAAKVEKEKSVTIYITPPFWMTWWFRIMLSLLVILIAIISFRFRISREKKDKVRLEELLQARTQEIEQSREQLANLNEKKDLIFSILSHDLRSPLTTLKGFLGLLIENGDTFTKEELKKHAELIRNSVSNSLDLIDNTLFWSLSQTGGIQFTPTHVSVSEMLDKMRGLYQLALARKAIELRIDVESNLYVMADENMLYVVLRNLTSNAIKFTPEGKMISVRAYKKEKQVILEVNDEGVGMSQDYITKLFTEAHPIIKKGTSNEKGTGLGLVLCQQFIAINGGTLAIESVEGVGSTFIVALPLDE